MNDSLTVGDLTFALRRSERRRTIGITVDRGGELILNAPVGCPSSLLEQVVLGRSLWIYGKLAEKGKLFRANAPKQYVSGEGFYYLGRSYRLLLVTPTQNNTPPLQLTRGRFMLRRDERHRAAQHFARWYISHGGAWLPRRVCAFAERIGVAPGKVILRDLKYRWGSCNPTSEVLYFHYRTMLLPPSIIDYIVVHELVHLLVPRHNAEFWRRIRLALPDYESRQRWLAENGARF